MDIVCKGNHFLSPESNSIIAPLTNNIYAGKCYTHLTNKFCYCRIKRQVPLITKPRFSIFPTDRQSHPYRWLPLSKKNSYSCLERHNVGSPLPLRVWALVLSKLFVCLLSTMHCIFLSPNFLIYLDFEFTHFKVFRTQYI